jgi:hypothetical protein
MDEPEDTDMTSSTILPALNHDRQDAGDAADAAMDMDQPQPEQTLEIPAPPAEDVAGADAVEVEAMDTTPDPTPDQDVVESPQPDIVSPTSPRPAETSDTQNSETPPATINTQPDGIVEGNGVVTPPPATVPPTSSDPAVVIEERRSSPESPRAGTSAEDRDDDDSSEEDEHGQGWHEIVEDTSSPDEQELKEIEGIEHSALERKFYPSGL